MKIDDKKINTPPYDEIMRLWIIAQKLGIPNYKEMTEDELKKAIKEQK